MYFQRRYKIFIFLNHLEFRMGKCKYFLTRLKSWIFKAVLSIFVGSRQFLLTPFNPKVYWGDGKQEEMESNGIGYQDGAILNALL
jgi:hypothetical protein